MAGVPGVTVPVVAWNWVTSAYAAAGEPEAALRVATELIRDGYSPDAVTMATVVTAFRRRLTSSGSGAVPAAAEGDAVLAAWQALLDAGGRPNQVAFNAMAAACGAAGRPDGVRLAMKQMRAAGLVPRERAWVALVHAHARCADAEGAEAALQEALDTEDAAVIAGGGVLGEMAAAHPAGAQGRGAGHGGRGQRPGAPSPLRRSVVLWGAAAGAFAASGRAADVERILDRARREGGVAPSAATDSMRIKALAIRGDAEGAARVLEEALAEGRPVNGHAWTTLCAAFAARGMGAEALAAIHRALDAGARPQASALVLVTRAFGDDTQLAATAWEALAERGVPPSLQAFNALARAYASAGDVAGATATLDRAQAAGFAPDSFSFRAAMHAAAVAGDPEAAEALLERSQSALGVVTVADMAILANAYGVAGDLSGALKAMERGEAVADAAKAAAEAAAAAEGDGAAEGSRAAAAAGSEASHEKDSGSEAGGAAAGLEADDDDDDDDDDDEGIVDDDADVDDQQADDSQGGRPGQRGASSPATALPAPAEARATTTGRDTPLVSLYNSAMKAAARCGDAAAAMGVLDRMRARGEEPSRSTMGVLAEAFVAAGCPADAEAAIGTLQNEGVKAALRPGRHAWTAIIDGWATEGVVDKAEAALQRLEADAAEEAAEIGPGRASEALGPDIVSYGALMRAYATAADGRGALALADRCEAAGLELTDPVYMSLVAAFWRSGDEEGAAGVIERMHARGHSPEPKLLSHLQHLIAQGAGADEAIASAHASAHGGVARGEALRDALAHSAADDPRA
ncbi:hypothetical protein FNF28_00327 [Cafeteria roenbergensis]|uniref:Pentatricopeptide repeat-containing protein-mitochondrial domain-containing protein n=1 Tax=Cafeteria roenbergensis TaxID=33653 RepID=A0A5A8E7I7_CAFRO|nr:hypothetical protein FNF28_00327 [Cafeteria roenbergensis]